VAVLHEKVAWLVGQPVEKMEDTQWIRHILRQLYLLEEMQYGLRAISCPHCKKAMIDAL